MHFTPLDSKIVRLEELLSANLRVPAFQRLYSWELSQWEALADDLKSSYEDKKPLFLGLCVVAKSNDAYEIIDGQQRLTTLALIMHALGDKRVMQVNLDGSHQIFVNPQEPDHLWLRKILTDEHTGDPRRYSQRLLSEALEYFRKEAENLDLCHLLNSQLIIYCSQDVQGATSLFERINLRGKQISSLELVKNKLYDWAARITNVQIRLVLEEELRDRFGEIFDKLNPYAKEGNIDVDAFLRTHWILFDDKPTKTTDFTEITRHIDSYMRNVDAGHDFSEALAVRIRKYVRSMSKTCIVWRKVVAPQYHHFKTSDLASALLSFQRMRRDSNFIPILVAAVEAWGDNVDTARYVRFVEIVCFRQALLNDQANRGRAAKWSLSKRIYRQEIDIDKAISTLFWKVCPWWDRAEAARLDPTAQYDVIDSEFAETAFSDTKAYTRYARAMKYFFWEYGRWLATNRQWPEAREDVSVLTDDQWEKTFQHLEIEHIFPQKPQSLQERIVKERVAQMANHLDHWGNLTLLTRHDNASLSNSNFKKKLADVLQNNSNLLFNKLLANAEYRGNLSNDAWSPNNCKKRGQALAAFANSRWGEIALRSFEISADPEFAADLEELEESADA